jgi:uncharacterized membrane-anchored protein
MLEGLHSRLPIDKPLAVAIIAPVVLVVVYFGIRRLRRVHGLSQ